MQPKVVRLIILFMFLAMTGLVGVQIIWIRRAVDQREEQFNQGVYEALSNISLDYQQASWRQDFEKMFNWPAFEAQVQQHIDSLNQLRVCRKEDSSSVLNMLSARPGLKKQHFSVRLGPFSPEDGLSAYYEEELQADFYSGSGLNPGDMLDQSREMIGQLFREMMTDFSMRRPTAIDTSLLREIIQYRLSNQGIKTSWVFGVLNGVNQGFEVAPSEYRKALAESPYRVPLGLNPFIPGPELLLHFPHKTGFLIKNLVFLLVASAVLIVIIIISFAATIFIIFRQKKIQEIKNDLINNITHELKTPISTISLACQAMGDPDLKEIPSMRDRYVGMIAEENKRLGMLVENVLQSAVFDRGEVELKLRKVDMHQKVERVLQSLEMQTQSKGIQLVRNLDAQQFVVEADEVMVTNLVFNLVDNAIKYSRKQEGSVVVSTWNEDHYLCIEIADNGIGISKDDQKRIFDKLYRVPTGNVHNVKGYGLGLSYVKSIVESHHGHIQVKSQLNEGSRFTVSLPLKQKKDD
jgi:signal transduction histidine kinase